MTGFEPCNRHFRRVLLFHLSYMGVKLVLVVGFEPTKFRLEDGCLSIRASRALELQLTKLFGQSFVLPQPFSLGVLFSAEPNTTTLLFGSMVIDGLPILLGH